MSVRKIHERKARGDETRVQAVLGWWSEHPTIDLAAATVFVVSHGLVVVLSGHGDWLLWIPAAQRQTAYMSGASVIALLGSVSAIGIAIYQSSDGDRARKVRSAYGPEMRRNFRSVLLATGFGALLCVAAIIANRTPATPTAASSGSATDPAFARFWFEFAVAVWALRYSRVIWIFTYVLGIRDQDYADEPRRPAPALGAAWRRSG